MAATSANTDEAKGKFWLEKAASHSQINAQVALANYLARPGSSAAERAEALDWLEKAVVLGSRDARYYLAAMLAAGPDAEQRNPRRALELLDDVMDTVDSDPSAYEILPDSTLPELPVIR